MTEPLPYESLPPGETPVWRYLSLAKMLDLLSTSSLYLARADTLDDPFEGSFTRQSMRAVYGDDIHEENVQLGRWLPCVSFINCWCATPHESAALWRIYGKAEGSLAIRSSVSALQRAFPTQEQHTGAHILSQAVRRVQYIDYQTEHPEANDLMGPLCYKRKAFSFEEEIRVVRQEIPDAPSARRPDGRAVQVGLIPVTKGVRVKVSISDLIQAVHVAPNSGEWVRAAVRSVMDRFDMGGIPCEQSALDALPEYARLGL